MAVLAVLLWGDWKAAFGVVVTLFMVNPGSNEIDIGCV
jgi:hypothetical protein